MADTETKIPRPDAADADRVVEEVKESHGDLAIDFKARVGARPFVRYTPYTNARGVKVNMWSCMSITAKPMPERTLLFRPSIVYPDEHEDYNVQMMTDEWVWRQVYHSRLVKIVPVEESPFGNPDSGLWFERGDA